MTTSTMLQAVSPDELRALIYDAVSAAQRHAEQRSAAEQHTEEHVLTRQEAARILRISMPTLSRRIKDGTIPVVRVCGRTLIRQEALIDLIERAESQKGGTP